MFEKDLTPDQIKELSALAVLTTAPGQANLILNVKKEMDKNWDKLRGEDGKHFVDGVRFGAAKSDAIKVYSEQLIPIVFRTIGGWHRGFSKETIAANNDEALTIINRIPAWPDLTHDKVFRSMMVYLFGYDSDLIDCALAETQKEKSDLLWRYVLNRFDVVMGTGETVKDADGTPVKQYPEKMLGGFYPENFFEYVGANQSDFYQNTATYIVNRDFPLARAVEFVLSDQSAK